MSATEVIPGVHQLSVGATNLVIIAEDELTLVDTGLPGSSMRTVNLIRRLGRSENEISSIIITHNHFDHIGGIPELRKLARFTIAAHRDGLAGPDAEPSYPPRFQSLRRLLRIPFMHPVRRRFVLESSDIDIPLEGGEILQPLGGLQVIHTPGHTPGSISLYSPRHKLLMVGDALQRRRNHLRLPARMVSTDIAQAVSSVKRLAEIDINIIIFGHGKPLMSDVRTRLEALIERGQS